MLDMIAELNDCIKTMKKISRMPKVFSELYTIINARMGSLFITEGY